MEYNGLQSLDIENDELRKQKVRRAQENAGMHNMIYLAKDNPELYYQIWETKAAPRGLQTMGYIFGPMV